MRLIALFQSISQLLLTILVYFSRHNGRALQVIEACLSILPDADSIAFFDSMFHSTMPKYVSRYAINPEVAESKGLRKYGFHGLSCAFSTLTPY